MATVPPGPLLPAYGTDVWRGGRTRRDIPTLPSGYADLDRRLPGKGWPLGALTELLTESPGSGEFSLLLPALAAVTASGRWAMLLDPPWVPYPPAMRGHGVALERVMLIRTRSAGDSLWACEQALRSVRGGMALAWHDDPGFTRLRRLQLAAKAGQKAAFLFRPAAAARQSSPSALRLHIRAREEDISVSILKCRGNHVREAIRVRRPQQLPGQEEVSRVRASLEHAESGPGLGRIRLDGGFRSSGPGMARMTGPSESGNDEGSRRPCGRRAIALDTSSWPEPADGS